MNCGGITVRDLKTYHASIFVENSSNTFIYYCTLDAASPIYDYSSSNTIIDHCISTIGGASMAYNLFGGTGDIYETEISGGYDTGVWVTNGGDYNVGTHVSFCNNGYDIFASSGGYAYAISNTYSRTPSSSVYGNVFLTGQNYVCSAAKSNVDPNIFEISPEFAELNSLDDRYLEIMRLIREDKKNKLYNKEKYVSEYEKLLESYKKLIKKDKDKKLVKYALHKVMDINSILGNENENKNYLLSLSSNNDLRGYSDIFLKFKSRTLMKEGKIMEALLSLDEAISTTVAADLTCEALYEKDGFTQIISTM